MSRIGKQPVPIPDKVKVEVKGQKVFVEGPKGKLDFELPRRTAAKIDKDNVLISRQGDDAEAKALQNMAHTKEKHIQLRRWRIRKKVTGSKARPRMSVKFTNENIYVQFIDDLSGVTIASASTVAKSVPDRQKLSANVLSAKRIGA